MKLDISKTTFPLLHQSASEEQPCKIGNINRLANKPAYLSVEFSSDGSQRAKSSVLSGETRQAAGSPSTKLRQVQGRDNQGKSTGIRDAITRWDRDERFRAKEYNTKVIVALAWMRIVRFAEAGTQDTHPLYSSDPSG